MRCQRRGGFVQRSGDYVPQLERHLPTVRAVSTTLVNMHMRVAPMRRAVSATYLHGAVQITAVGVFCAVLGPAVEGASRRIAVQPVTGARDAAQGCSPIARGARSRVSVRSFGVAVHASVGLAALTKRVRTFDEK